MADQIRAEPNRDQMFPALTTAQIARIAPLAKERVLSDGERLWTQGDRNRPLFVVVEGGIEIRSGQIGNLHPSFDASTLRARSVELARSGRVVLGGLPRHELPVEEASAGFAALRRPAEVLQVVFRYV